MDMLVVKEDELPFTFTAEPCECEADCGLYVVIRRVEGWGDHMAMAVAAFLKKREAEVIAAYLTSERAVKH